MGQLSTAHVSDGAVVNASDYNTLVDDIKTAFNSLSSGNFASGCNIPNVALANDEFEYTLELGDDSVSSGQTIGTQRDYVIVPVDSSTLTAVKVFCESRTGSANPTVDIYKESSGASVLSGAVTLAADATVYSATISASSFSADDVLSLRVTTDGTGSITYLRVVLLFKKQLV